MIDIKDWEKTRQIFLDNLERSITEESFIVWVLTMKKTIDDTSTEVLKESLERKKELD